jgi:hypothetical protein
VQLRKAVGIQVAPLPGTLHQVYQAPKHLFFILNEVQEHPDDVVETLHVADFIVIVAKRFEHVEELVVPSAEVLLKQLQVHECARYILRNHVFSVGVSIEFEQLQVKLGRMGFLGLLNVEQFEPQLAPMLT